MAGGEIGLKDNGSRRQVVLAGGIAGLFSRFCIAPLDVVKIRLQLSTHKFDPLNPHAHGTLSVAKSIFRNEGIKGFWRGNVPAELMYMTYGGAQFVTYRSVSQILSPTPIPAQATSFISGAAAGAAATTVTYPLDLLRTRFAAQGNSKVYHGFLSSLAQIRRTEGFPGFFQGLRAGIGQIVPYMGLFFAGYESLRPRMRELDLPFGSGDAAAGVVAGVMAKTGVFPLDVIRKRLQVQGPSRTKFAGGVVPEYERGVLATGRAIILKEGWRGLYRGLTIGLIKAAPTSAATMWSYELALKVLLDNRIGT